MHRWIILKPLKMKWDKRYWVHTPVLVQSGKWKGEEFQIKQKEMHKNEIKGILDKTIKSSRQSFL